MGIAYNPSMSKQAWKIGESVKVGFVTLKVVSWTGHAWRLVNAKGEEYEFTPYKGLFKATIKA